MKRLRFVLIAVILMVSVSSSFAKNKHEKLIPYRAVEKEGSLSVDRLNPPVYKSSVADTYTIVAYDFNTNYWQGWTRVDNTAQVDTFFHVDDFSGLGGGDFGRLVPLDGTKSMWCGVRPDTSNSYLCYWESAPGYGNLWNQMLVTGRIDVTGFVNLRSKVMYDTESDYDFLYIEYQSSSNGQWQELTSLTGVGDTTLDVTTSRSMASTKLRFRFESDGAWSDQDGLYNSDGATIIDNISVSDDNGLIDYEDFEAWPIGAVAHAGSIWHADVGEAFGKYSGLWNNLMDKDPCGDNFTTQVVFFVGSTIASSSYPGLYDTPFCSGDGNVNLPCQDEYVISPIIDMTKYSTGSNEVQDADIPPGVLGDLGGAILSFTVYRDLPLNNLVFYRWRVRNVSGSGCPEDWLERDFVYYGSGDYIRANNYIGDFVQSNHLQISLGVIDMCGYWYLSFGDCAHHTPAPWFDNVVLKRYSLKGPQFTWRDLDIFQDNFPESEYDLSGWVRADAANDLNANDNPVIRPGDSAVVGVTSPLGGGIAADPAGGPAVYLHVHPHWVGPSTDPHPDLYGPTLVGTYGLYKSDNTVWTVIQCDTARHGENPVVDKYMVDLNDSLFTRGYQVDYYFEATDNNSNTVTLPRHAANGVYFEFTCLPTLTSDILYVDDFHGRGSLDGTVQHFFDPTFEAVLPSSNQPDRYDVNNPSSSVSNSPATRATLSHYQIAYRKIIWDSGNLNNTTISDGTVDSDKGDDCTLLVNWMNTTDDDVGLWVLGDNVAYDFANNLTSTQSVDLMSNWCGVSYVADGYYDETGGRVSGGVVTPLVKGPNTGIFNHGGVPDSFYVFGGCPVINEFDCLDKGTTANYALDYPDFNGTHYHAAIQNVKANASSHSARTMWFGFSFMYIRDADLDSPPIRNHIFKDVIEWMQNQANEDITGETVPAAYKLTQNFPNPFNPSTTIRFDMKAKGHVSLKVYNVAGQLVKTLADGVFNAGSYDLNWNGTNNNGAKVASGVYFYKMETKNFSQTKKMVMLR